MDRSISDRCPYIGLKDDPDTALGYPSIWNHCHNVRTKTVPSSEHQREICLSAKHATCPAFVTEGKNALPREIRMPGSRRFLGRTILRWAMIGIVVVFLVGSSLILSGYWVPPWAQGIVAKMPIRPVASNTSMAEMLAEVLGTDTPAQANQPVIEASSTVAMILPTQTETVQVGTCAYPLETPFGTTQQFVLHQVASGENMTSISEDYQTTEEMIDAVNYFLPSPLWSELVIVIPHTITTTDDLFSLKPVFVQNENISVGELAENLSVPLQELLTLNALDPACRSFSGWVLIPADKIIVSP